MPTITILGSCRQDSLYNYYPITKIKNELTYPHYTKEIIQALEFCKGISDISLNDTKYIFRSGILENKTINYLDFKDDFEKTDIFILEIASRIAYTYNNNFVHHILSEKEYNPSFYEKVYKYDLTDEEIENDIIYLKKLIYPKKLIIISHISTKSTGKRYELVQLLKRLTSKYDIPFFNPIDYLKDMNYDNIFEKPEDAFHYTQYGHSIIGQFYKNFIENIY